MPRAAADRTFDGAQCFPDEASGVASVDDVKLQEAEAEAGKGAEEEAAVQPVASTDMALPDAVYQQLATLDDHLVELLQRGDIRFVRRAWLLQQPRDYRIVCRQELEKLESSGAMLSPVLSPHEGAALIRKGNRSVGVLSHGWLEAPTHRLGDGGHLTMGDNKNPMSKSDVEYHPS